MSLYYAGYDSWPTVAALPIPPLQILDYRHITIFCSNGLTEDTESLTFDLMDHPITNSPPVIEDVEDQIFYIGEGPQEYQLYATDPDSFTFTSDIQFKPDIENLSWSVYFKAFPFAYTLHPFIEPLIDRESGLVSFNPQFEGAYEIVVTVCDPDGAEDSAEFTIYCVKRSSGVLNPNSFKRVSRFSCFIILLQGP